MVKPYRSGFTGTVRPSASTVIVEITGISGWQEDKPIPTIAPTNK